MLGNTNLFMAKNLKPSLKNIQNNIKRWKVGHIGNEECVNTLYI